MADLQILVVRSDAVAGGGHTIDVMRAADSACCAAKRAGRNEIHRYQSEKIGVDVVQGCGVGRPGPLGSIGSRRIEAAG